MIGLALWSSAPGPQPSARCMGLVGVEEAEQQSEEGQDERCDGHADNVLMIVIIVVVIIAADRNSRLQSSDFCLQLRHQGFELGEVVLDQIGLVVRVSATLATEHVLASALVDIGHIAALLKLPVGGGAVHGHALQSAGVVLQDLRREAVESKLFHEVLALGGEHMGNKCLQERARGAQVLKVLADVEIAHCRDWPRQTSWLRVKIDHMPRF
mmetsp:Transcript_21296/g.29549  ORF Transcript_21296/g.29549 Transcript_21296/m.29549 type:complete len:212 (-) Transcript_21296:2143-2778(-)